jgi:hypothetical protein
MSGFLDREMVLILAGVYRDVRIRQASIPITGDIVRHQMLDNICRVIDGVLQENVMEQIRNSKATQVADIPSASEGSE